MLAEKDWFTEVAEAAGSAFSLRVKQRLHREESPFQTIEVYETETFGNLMVIDGFTMLSTRENFLYHEMLSHPVLLTHPAPRRVAIIGGGDCGTLREVLRHPEIESAVQIDIDERVTRVAEQFFPELTESNADPRATLLCDDGIRWMRETPEQSLDVIIIDSTDPVGPAEGLFTTAFYRDCHRALAPGGLLVQQSESPLYHMDIIRGIYADTAAAGFQDRATLFFPQAIYPSGWWSATLVSRDQAIPAFRAAAASNLPFATRYYTAEIHRAALAQPAFFKQAFASTNQGE
ncbi:polyamine aminopropyltransferase [Lamprobacter modestohalophilus]|uniref:polyamine aminopropyltransferase n=1 Tax=Lamprobacter modestohalophilus TaxID=1064514 RepID=UPI002ADEFC33|nr:polyamine aminopropyltransferase [Lamprobacter modestohalophilus]MEA1051465.1 polyamine aminopropyltransferase [Lamprobacter modestohalophilus]